MTNPGIKVRLLKEFTWKKKPAFCEATNIEQSLVYPSVDTIKSPGQQRFNMLEAEPYTKVQKFPKPPITNKDVRFTIFTAKRKRRKTMNTANYAGKEKGSVTRSAASAWSKEET